MSRRILIDELEFEVPYGKLAAKTWHEETDDCKRILALHGWMDNAGSFDNLMPNLKFDQSDMYIVALDLPGHGKSSQLPPGSSYSDMNIIMEVRRCLTELGWIQRIGAQACGAASSTSTESRRKKFTIIGHSLGAGVGLCYASLYPDDVEAVILLDFFKTRTIPVDKLLDQTAETIDQFLNLVPSQSPFSSPVTARVGSASKQSSRNADKGQVVVSQETAIIATIEAHKKLGNLTRAEATCLLKRSTIAVNTPPNSVIYSRDLRLNSMLNMREHLELNKILFGRGKCNVLFVLAKEGLYAEDPEFKDNMDTLEEHYRRTFKSCHIQWIKADHYLHMNQAQKTAEIINKYLKSPADYQVAEEQ